MPDVIGRIRAAKAFVAALWAELPAEAQARIRGAWASFEGAAGGAILDGLISGYSLKHVLSVSVITGLVAYRNYRVERPRDVWSDEQRQVQLNEKTGAASAGK